jgi:hypothetical protein
MSCLRSEVYIQLAEQDDGARGSTLKIFRAPFTPADSGYSFSLTVIPVALSERTLDVTDTVAKKGRLARAAGWDDPALCARERGSFPIQSVIQSIKQ